jgi:two-component system, cell cycle sensor histidine kinase and response regulator CckA
MNGHDGQKIARELKNIKNALDEAATVAVTDPTGRISYVNDKFCEISKYSREELLGQTPRIVNSNFHPPEFFHQMWQTISSGKTWRGEIRNRAKDGTIYWVSTTIVPVLDEQGKPHQYIAVLYDITERKQAEQSILEKNQLLEQTYDAILTWNLDVGITYWNQNAVRLYGYTEKEALGHETQNLLKTVYPHSYLAFLAEIEEKGFWEGELIHTTKTGEEVIVEGRMQVIRREGSNLIVLETLRDISERKQLENKLARAAQLSLVGELAAGLAHEIKNPLAGIKGVIDIILQRRSTAQDPEREVLESVQFEIERIDRTVRELLRQSRLKPLEVKIESLNETVRRAVQFASHHDGIGHSAGRKIATEIHLPKSPLLVAHDSASIESALLNLILNAREAVRNKAQGEIFVRIAKTKKKNGAGEILIEVSDNGCGIPKNKLEQIFVPFYTTGKGGTGLGLVAVRRIARAHGGNCEVRSIVGKGSTFTIRLPYDSPAARVRIYE